MIPASAAARTAGTRLLGMESWKWTLCSPWDRARSMALGLDCPEPKMSMRISPRAFRTPPARTSVSTAVTSVSDPTYAATNRSSHPSSRRTRSRVPASTR